MCGFNTMGQLPTQGTTWLLLGKCVNFAILATSLTIKFTGLCSSTLSAVEVSEVYSV